MAILKSEIVGKSLLDLSDLIKGMPGSSKSNPVWRSLPTKHLAFIDKCTLRYPNSYGAKYKIDLNHELIIKHTTNGISYTLESYRKLFNMIITDYDDDTQSSQEQPMSTPQDIKVGSHWERMQTNSVSEKGEIVIVEEVDGDAVYFNKNRNLLISDFLERFKPRPDLNTPVDSTNASCEFSIGDLICYTEEARDTLLTAKGTLPNEVIGTVTKVLDRTRLGSTPLLEYKDIQGTELNIDSGWVTKHIATPIKAKTTKPKPKPVAQQEPIQSITKETFMSKLKAVATTTVDQNKQALVIASKMEAGRIINKQVLKQLKPYLPFFLQGYASSPFAPLLAANLVAMASNYVDDSRIKKVSELMLLGAADSGVSSLNISKIIDDVLSNIKLPAGVLDDSDDE